jgi:hypothetical protein
MNHSIDPSDPGGMNRYRHAIRLLDDLKHKRIPSDDVFAALYGTDMAPVLKRTIGRFLDANDALLGIPREHSYDAPSKVADTRDRIEEDVVFQDVQYSLLFGELPDQRRMENMYGRYAQDIQKAYSRFYKLNLKRHCGLPSVAHMNRVGAVVRGLPMDEEGKTTYAAAAALHDVIEDLLYRDRDDDGKPYDLSRYNEFVETMIPEDLHPQVITLTNHFDLLISYVQVVLREQDRFVSPINIQMTLEKLHNVLGLEIQPYIEKMHYLLAGVNIGGDIVEAVKWICYKETYIAEMAVRCHSYKDYRVYEIKGIDLSDNGHGRGSLALSSRVKNLIKHQIWIDSMRRCRPTWLPMMEMIQELQENILRDSEDLILRDLMEPQSHQDFVHSAMHKIRELRQILFV